MAVNANTGEFAWRIVFGVTDELPEGKKNTGRVNGGGSIATAGGLVFIGATNDKRFHAFDSKTGKLLWEIKLEYDAIATPITYSGQKRQAVRRDHGLGRTGDHRSESRLITNRSTCSRCRKRGYFCLALPCGGTTWTSYSV